MAPPISTSLHHLFLPLFLAFSVTAAGPNHGIGPRKTGKGHGHGGGGGGGKKGGLPITPLPVQPMAPGGDIETNFKGSWTIDNPNVGVAAMQFQLMPNNKAVWFDTTSLGPSARELGPPGNCPKSPEMGYKPDCFAHAISYDVETGQSRTIYVRSIFLFVKFSFCKLKFI